MASSANTETACKLIATMSVLGTYDDTLLSVHMIQHMVLSMVVPVFLCLGAPVTLALRTLPLVWRQRLVALLHTPRSRAGAALGRDGRLYLFGGTDVTTGKGLPSRILTMVSGISFSGN